LEKKMKTTGLIKSLIIIGIVLLVLGLGVNLISPMFYGGAGNWAYDDCGMWGGRGMMDGWNNYGMTGTRSFGWIGMLLGLIITLGIFVLLIAGIAWLVDGARKGNLIGTSGKIREITCPNCGKPIQAEWQNCPHCGSKINQ
jgi:DNA-directed RNA polymerase subunit RPC12/RpoP